MIRDLQSIGAAAGMKQLGSSRRRADRGRFPQHVHRHAILGGRFKNQLRIAGAALDFLAEIRTQFLEVIR